ncbi:maleylpyruvate isomerase N-terminal domain-containing protein [Streptomyces sp. NPDC007206]|uniref:maleylpyruvate isomerase N-terminal domain-containing protein n=1 Tax=Streptomyces sp. NPDC007206 TaxID=3154317 RepID=UPI0033F001F7
MTRSAAQAGKTAVRQAECGDRQRSGRDSGVPRRAAAPRRAVGRLPCRGRLRARPRRAGADLPRVDAGRSGAAPGRGAQLVGRHDRRGPAPPRPGPHRTTQRLLDALREAGPGRGCWTWWGTWQSPRTCGAVARHQLQEIAVHTYDAQLTAGAPQPLPDEVALDGVEDFLFTCCATTAAWPHRPAVVDYHATEAAPGAPGCPPTAHGPPACPARPRTRPTPPPGHGRLPLDSLKLDGDRRLFELLQAWEPEG